MPIYEKRTYDIAIGKMPDVVQLYTSGGWAAFEASGLDQHLVGYFISDTGPLNRLIHIWRFEDDAARRSFWQDFRSNPALMEFGAQVGAFVTAQDVQLLANAPWGPNP